MAFVEPITLRGAHVALEPLAREHEEGLRTAAADGELWQLWYTSIPASAKTLEDVARHYATFFGAISPIVLTEQDQQDMVAYMKLLR